MVRRKWDKKRPEVEDPNSQPKGYKYWNPEAGRWQKRSPADHALWIQHRRRLGFKIYDKKVRDEVTG